MNHILIVEDDRALSTGITLALQSGDVALACAYTLAQARALLADRPFDLVLLDLNLPDGNGLSLLQQLHLQKGPALLVLTANDLETDIVTGLELGADDYVTKPFSLAVLRAKVHALLRRRFSQRTPFSIDSFVFDFEQLRFSKGGQQIELSKTEQRLLRLLVENRGIVMTRDRLIEGVWAHEADSVEENALSVSVRRLRDKLEDVPSSPVYIKTVYGIGYTWAVSP